MNSRTLSCTIGYPVLMVTLLAAILVVPQVGHAWIDFKPEELTMTPPEWCKDADAMVLLKSTDYSLNIGRQFSLSAEHTLRIKIFTEEGKDNGDLTLVEPYGQKLSNITARTILPDGRTVKLKTNQIFKKVIPAGAGNDYRRTVYQFALPEVQVGSILEVHYGSHSKYVTFVEPFYFDFSGLPTKTSLLSFTFPQGAQYRGSFINGSGYSIKDTVESLNTTEGPKKKYSIGASRIRLDFDERLPPPEDYVRPCFYLVFSRYQEPGISIDIMPDWAEATKSALSFTEDFLRQGKLVEAIVQRIAPAGTPAESQARSLFRWVADSLELVDSKYCYDFEGNAEAKIKACKATGAEKVLTLKTLYDRVGLTSELVLCVPSTESPGIKKIPAMMQFRRMLLRLHLGDKTLFLDPAEPSACFDLIPAEFEYAVGLPIVKGNEDVITTPQSPRRNRREYDCTCSLDSLGDLHGSCTLRVTGHHYVRVYRQFVQADSTARREYLTKQLLTDIPSASLVRLDEPSVFVDSADIRLSFGFTIRGYGKNIGEEMLLIPNCLDRVLPDYLPPDEARSLPIYFGSPTESEMTIRYTLPAGYRCAMDSSNGSERMKNFIRFTSSLTPADGGRSFVYSRSYQRIGEVYEAAEYEKLRQFFEKVAASDAQEAILQRTLQ